MVSVRTKEKPTLPERHGWTAVTTSASVRTETPANTRVTTGKSISHAELSCCFFAISLNLFHLSREITALEIAGLCAKW